MHNSLLERSNNLVDSQRLWSEVVNKYSLKVTQKDYTINDFTTRLYYLTNPQHLTVRGSGKGASLPEIDASASYEAIEFYLSSYNLHHYSTIKAQLSEITKQYPIILQRCNPQVFQEEAHKQATAISWILYQDAITTEKYAAPLATIDLHYFSELGKNDNFSYDACEVYSSSNGLSSGSTYEESVIHGALEILERDAYSYFLIDTYLLNKQPHIVDKKTLPNPIAAYVEQIEKNLNNQVIIIKMPSRFGVECFLATFQHSEFSFKPRGSGASLSTHYAIERAVYELVQSHLLMHGNYFANTIDPVRLKTNQLIKNFLQLNLPMKQHNAELIPFAENNVVKQLSLKEYLAKLIELIKAQASSLLIKVMHQDENGLTCTSIKIPGAEELCLATYYIQVEPTPGMNYYIQEYLGKKFDWKDFTNPKRDYLHG